jgi:hypothetical protein
VNVAGQEIEIYQLANGAWSAQPPYAVASVTDAALTPDGKLLIVLTQQGVGELALPIGSSAIKQRASNPDSSCGQYLSSLAMANDGRAFIVSDLTMCSGLSATYLYDVTSYSISNIQAGGALTDLNSGVVAGGADGSELFAASTNLSGGTLDVMTFNAKNNSVMLNISNVMYDVSAIAVSGDASRVILNNVDVYSGSLTLLGHLPTPSTGGQVLMSRDSSRAYLYHDESGTAQLDIYNLNGSLLSGSIYPLLKTVTLADLPSSQIKSYSTIALAESADGSTVFVSGNSKIVVQPVN